MQLHLTEVNVDPEAYETKYEAMQAAVDRMVVKNEIFFTGDQKDKAIDTNTHIEERYEYLIDLIGDDDAGYKCQVKQINTKKRKRDIYFHSITDHQPSRHPRHYNDGSFQTDKAASEAAVKEMMSSTMTEFFTTKEKAELDALKTTTGKYQWLVAYCDRNGEGTYKCEVDYISSCDHS